MHQTLWPDGIASLSPQVGRATDWAECCYAKTFSRYQNRLTGWAGQGTTLSVGLGYELVALLGQEDQTEGPARLFIWGPNSGRLVPCLIPWSTCVNEWGCSLGLLPGPAGRDSVGQDMNAGCCNPCRFPHDLLEGRPKWKLPKSAPQCWGSSMPIMGSLFTLEGSRLRGDLPMWCSASLGWGNMYLLLWPFGLHDCCRAVLQPHLHILDFFQFLGRGAKSGIASVTFLVISPRAHDNLRSHFCSLHLHYFSLPFSILCGWGFPNGSKIFSSFMSPITRFSNDGWPTRCCWKVCFLFSLETRCQ